MKKIIRQFVAAFLALWLPIFSGGAAAMVTCPHMSLDGKTTVTIDHQMHAGHHSPSSDPSDLGKQAADCSQCGICLFACSPGITAQFTAPDLVPAHEPHLTLDEHFVSITLPIFDPPPLSRA